ncbi:MAG: hypothetical protein ACK4K7_14870 [Allosphingosinicella sp.]|uniref:hypothetical protein n=1 Tax=Allosphingosinicella sp. TaxID=2823234 RepID=UPI003958903E
MKLPKAVGQFAGGSRWTKESRIWIPEISEEHRVRIDRLKKDMRLEERARTDAYLLQPASDDTVLNETQLDICNRVFAGILMLNQFLAEQMGAALDGARRRLPEKLREDDLRQRVSIEARTAFADHRGPLRQARRQQMEAGLNLRFFRNANNLTRTATYKESGVLVVGIILALLVIESAANGVLFRDIVRGGWLQGVQLALLVSILNVGFGVAAGLCWSYAGHVLLLKRVIGWIGSVVLHGAALYWNLLVAHFREVAEAAARDPLYDFDPLALADAAATQMTTNGWFGLSTIFAWALFGLGMLIHLFAAREGWDDIGDRYPDYAKYDRRAKQAEIDFENASVAMRADARAAAETVVREAQRLADQGRRDANAISDLLNLVGQREQEVRDSEREWVAGGTQLLRTYRDINQEVRGSNPAPAYFAVFPKPDDYRRGDFGADLTRFQRDDFDRQITERRLVLLSDMMQHSDLLSHYGRGVAHLRRGAGALDGEADAQADMSEAAIRVQYVRRRGLKTQGEAHQDFWRDFFEKRGAQDIAIGHSLSLGERDRPIWYEPRRSRKP